MRMMRVLVHRDSSDGSEKSQFLRQVLRVVVVLMKRIVLEAVVVSDI